MRACSAELPARLPAGTPRLVCVGHARQALVWQEQLLTGAAVGCVRPSVASPIVDASLQHLGEREAALEKAQAEERGANRSLIEKKRQVTDLQADLRILKAAQGRRGACPGAVQGYWQYSGDVGVRVGAAAVGVLFFLLLLRRLPSRICRLLPSLPRRPSQPHR